MHIPQTQADLLLDDDLPAVEVINAQGRAPLVLVCEHASRHMPKSLNGLGLSPVELKSHVAWDIGARDVAVAMSEHLNAPLVASCVSRLIYDCNRPPAASGSIPAKSELVAVPGNQRLSEAARQARIDAVYTPFHDALRSTVDQVTRQASTPPTLLTIHSFTPVYFGVARDVEVGILHDANPTLAKAMVSALKRRSNLKVALNQPYSAADGVTHTLAEHATPALLPNAMVEIRNDLIDDPDKAQSMAALLSAVVQEVAL